MEAYQHKIRIEKSKEESLDFDHTLLDLKSTKIRLINKSIASEVILEYEWLHSMPYIVNYCFGLYFNVADREVLGGVLVYSTDYAENTGVWKKYGFEDKLLLLSRGVCLWWTPKNSASYFISKACKWLKENTKYKYFTATVDPAAGEIGTIYQSLNWLYVGVMSGNYHNKKETKRFAVIIGGKLRSSRWVRNKLGTMKKEVILNNYPDAKFVHQYRKRRYFILLNDKRSNNTILNKLKHLILPYPKRNENVIGIVYMIRNKINNKKYVGQTVRAFNDRINDYKRGYGNDYINNAFNKYGWDNFEFNIIDSAQTIEELNTKEIRYILQHKSNDRNFGYNIESGGNNSIPTTETIEKMSRSHLGIEQTDEWINKRIATAGTEEAKKYGKKKSDEEKNVLSENSPKYWLGKKRSEETKKKISETKRKNGPSEKLLKSNYKKVYQKDPNTLEIMNEFISTTEASSYIGVNQSTMSRWCSKNKVMENYLWTYNFNNN